MPSFNLRLANILKQLPAVEQYWIALSGGLDSQVLLYAMATLRHELPGTSLHAIHIDHRIQPESAEWAASCAVVCQQLNIDYHCHAIEVLTEAGDSLEAVARDKRYAVFASLIKSGDCLLTAHHQDDQAETLLLQLMRGAGPHGLAAMPVCTTFAGGHHARPMLDTTREELEAYATAHALTWVDDKSNADTRFDRNYMRHEIIPMLRKRWPAVSRTVSRSALLNAEAASLLDRLARDALADIAGTRTRTLSVSALKNILLDNGGSECRNLLRFWLQQSGLPLPGFVHLQSIIDTVLNAKQDATPLLQWHGAEVRRYGDDLFAMRPLASHDASRRFDWDMTSDMPLDGGKRLTAVPVSGEGLGLAKVKAAQVTVQFRQGGERCKPAGQAHSHTLKNLMQTWRIPPWERDRIPLIYLDGELASVTGHCICEGFQASTGEAGVRVVLDCVTP